MEGERGALGAEPNGKALSPQSLTRAGTCPARHSGPSTSLRGSLLLRGAGDRGHGEGEQGHQGAGLPRSWAGDGGWAAGREAERKTSGVEQTFVQSSSGREISQTK